MRFYRVQQIADFETYYLLKCQDDAVLWSGFSSAPDKERLYNHFVQNILGNDNLYLYYLEDNGEIIGYVQGSHIDDTNVEFSATNIFKKFQGLGYLQDMTLFLSQEMKRRGYRHAIGWVSEHNEPAEYNFKFNKFSKTDIFDEREMPLLGGRHKFYKWVKDL